MSELDKPVSLDVTNAGGSNVGRTVPTPVPDFGMTAGDGASNATDLQDGGLRPPKGGDE